jgi:hypothetical protein
VLWSLVACGGRGPLLPGEVSGAADDDQADDTPPASTGQAGSGAGGKRSMPSTGGMAGKTGASAGAMNAEAGEGGAAPGPLSDVDYYVDIERGNDANPGSEQEPFKTVEHALGLAIDGDTVWFEDGVWGWQNEPAFHDDRTLVVRSGVELRARHAGAAQLFDHVDVFDVGGLVFEGDAKLFGLHFIGFNPAIRADHGLIELDAVSFESPWDEGICNYGEHALIMLSGSAQAIMRGDAGEGAARASSCKCLARLDDSAVLRVEGGQVTGAHWESYPEESAVFSTFGESELHVSDLTVRGNTLPIIGAWDRSKVSVERTGFQGGGLFDDRAPSLIHVSDDAELDVRSSWFDGADLQPCLVASRTPDHYLASAKVTLSNTSFSHCGAAIALQSNSRVRLENVSISDSFTAIHMGDGIADGSLEIIDSRIANNRQHGIELDAGYGTFTFSMRGSTVTRNGADGIRVGRSPAAGGVLSLDLGTVDRAGTNLLLGNGTSSAGGVSLRIADDVATTLFAVGNVWALSTQGSDSGGGYWVNGLDATVYDADHLLAGINYAFVGQQSQQVTLRLAERTPLP